MAEATVGWTPSDSPLPDVDREEARVVVSLANAQPQPSVVGEPAQTPWNPTLLHLSPYLFSPRSHPAIYRSIVGLTPGFRSIVLCGTNGGYCDLKVEEADWLSHASQGIDVHPCHMTRIHTRALAEVVAENLRARYGPIDAVVAHLGGSGWKALQLGRALSAPILTIYHGSDATKQLASARYGANFDQLKLAPGAYHVGVSENLVSLLKEFGFPTQRCAVHHLGIDLDNYPKSDLRPQRKLKLSMVGRMVPQKGHHLAIDAVHRLSREYPEAQLHFFGSGPMREELAGRVAELGLETHVRFRGTVPVDVLREELRTSHVVLQPSVTDERGADEGLPNAVLEAFAVSRPVVATANGGIVEVVRHDETGLLAEPDPAAIARAVRRLARNEILAQRLGHEGRRLVESEFDLAKQSERLGARIKEMIATYRAIPIDARARAWDAAAPPQLPPGPDMSASLDKSRKVASAERTMRDFARRVWRGLGALDGTVVVFGANRHTDAFFSQVEGEPGPERVLVVAPDGSAMPPAAGVSVIGPAEAPPQPVAGVIVSSEDDEEGLLRQAESWVESHRLAPTSIWRLYADLYARYRCSVGAPADRLRFDLPPGAFAHHHASASYAIVGGPRSGSGLLCRLLADTGLAGRPSEHYRQTTANLVRDHQLGLPGFVTSVCQMTASPSGLVGTKLFFPQLERMNALIRRDGLGDDLVDLLPGQTRIVYLTRNERVRQAVSHWRARMTGEYTRQLGQTGPPLLPTYDYGQIQWSLDRVEEINRNWEAWFQTRGISPMRLSYEDLVADLEGSVRAVLEYVGVEVPHDFQLPQVKLVKQADELSEKWVRDFVDGVGRPANETPDVDDSSRQGEEAPGPRGSTLPHGRGLSSLQRPLERVKAEIAKHPLAIKGVRRTRRLARRLRALLPL